MKAIVTSLLLLIVASPSMADALTDELIALEKTAWTAWAKQDGQAFRELLTEDAVQAVAGADVTVGRDRIMAAISGHGCITKSFEFQGASARQLAPDLAVVRYTAVQDASCGGTKLPAKVYATNLYTRQEGKWRSLAYQETPLE
jgi:uncharacterized protein (TIGR02246 family)